MMGLAWCADHAGPLLAPGYRNLAVIRLRAAPADMSRAYMGPAVAGVSACMAIWWHWCPWHGAWARFRQLQRIYSIATSVELVLTTSSYITLTYELNSVPSPSPSTVHYINPRIQGQGQGQGHEMSLMTTLFFCQTDTGVEHDPNTPYCLHLQL